MNNKVTFLDNFLIIWKSSANDKNENWLAKLRRSMAGKRADLGRELFSIWQENKQEQRFKGTEAQR